jgi:erythromycin esterase-like protein
MTETRWRIAAGAFVFTMLLTGCTDEGATGINPTPQPGPADEALIEAVRAEAHPLRGAASDYDPLVELAADARFVLLGENTHGTREFYQERARITLRLTGQEEFTAIAVEGDWYPAQQVNRYLMGESNGTAAQTLTGAFNRFPRWMWANQEFAGLAETLRQRNAQLPRNERVAFYGLDLQSHVYESLDAVVAYLEETDPVAADTARRRYLCFTRHGRDMVAYAQAAAERASLSCADEARTQWEELQARYEAATPADAAAFDALFHALQNARVVYDAESFYLATVRGGVEGWNLRDRHMARTLEAIVEHQRRMGRAAKVVVWAHNTHVGDARATDALSAGQLSLGQLLRQAHGDDAVLVGFTTHDGTVTAAEAWGQEPRTRTLAPALAGSYAGLFQAAGAGDFLLVVRGNDALSVPLARERLQRAVGVVYDARNEREAHYFGARLAAQFDAVVFLGATLAVRPLG